jgi:PKD repeat protein
MESLIDVNDGPIVDFDFIVNGAKANFTNLSSSDANAFTWDFGDGGQLSNEKDPFHTYFANGNYSVKLFASNECGQKSKTRNVLVNTVMVNDLDLKNLILYPNPNDGVFSLGFDTPEAGIYNFRVFNAIGGAVSDKNYMLGAGPNAVDFALDELPNGLYLIKVSKEMKSLNILFSKQ